MDLDVRHLPCLSAPLGLPGQGERLAQQKPSRLATIPVGSRLSMDLDQLMERTLAPLIASQQTHGWRTAGPGDPEVPDAKHHSVDVGRHPGARTGDRDGGGLMRALVKFEVMIFWAVALVL